MHNSIYSLYKQALFGFGKPKVKTYTTPEIALDTLKTRLSNKFSMPYLKEIRLGSPVKYRFTQPSRKYAPTVQTNDPDIWLNQLINYDDENDKKYSTFNVTDYVPEFVLKNKVLSLPFRGYYRYGAAADAASKQVKAQQLVSEAFKDRPDIVNDFKELESYANKPSNICRAALLLPSIFLGYKFGRHGYRAGMDKWDSNKPIRSALYTAYRTLLGGSLGSLTGGLALWATGLNKLTKDWETTGRANGYYQTKSKLLLEKLKDINNNPEIQKSLKEQQRLLAQAAEGKPSDTSKSSTKSTTSKPDTKKDTSKPDKKSTK